MRRMATNKQLELIDSLSKVTKINNYSEIIEVPFMYLSKKEIEDALEEREGDELLDFENHILSSMFLSYYLTEEDAEDQTNYATVATEDEIAFPNTINTISDLANWLMENGLPLENIYFDDSDYSQEGYDFSDGEYEYDGHIVTLIGYRDNQSTILQFGNDEDPIDRLYAYIINSGSIQTDLLTISSLSSSRDFISVSRNLVMNPNVYIHAQGGIYGQLGAANFKSNAYINKLFVEEINSASSGKVTIGNCYIDIKADWAGGDQVIKLIGLPTEDPEIENALWNDNGVLKISAGE